MIGASNSHPSTPNENTAPAGQQMYHSLRYGADFYQHIEAEPTRISIKGLTSGYMQTLDFCVPVTRSHPGNEGQRCNSGPNITVEHIDISTAWNGLSDLDANELFRVHRAFLSTLEDMLANELWQIYQQLQQQDSVGNISPIHTLFSEGVVRGISFCRDQLVSEMAEVLYSSQENVAKAKSGFLRLYLIATDALIQYREDGPRDTSITIRMRCDSPSLRPYPVVDAAWVPDSLLFEGLNELPLEGQTFTIIPRYCSKSAFRPTRFPNNVKYTIESELRYSPLLSWLIWDDEIAGFKGIMPFYSEVNGYGGQVANTDPDSCESISHILKIIVQAMLVDDNGSSIRYERILRTRLTIKVVPWYANGNSWKTKERVSVPKAYQDTRLASAAQRFALQNPKGSPPCELSQWSIRAHLYPAIDYAPTGRVRYKDKCLAVSQPATREQLTQPNSSDLAQTQAQLVAKCAGLTNELENLKEQMMMSDPAGEHRKMTLLGLDPQECINETFHTAFNHHTRQEERISRSSFPNVSHYASGYLSTPSSPLLHGKDASFQLGPIARISALPSPAVGVRTRKKANSEAMDNLASSKPCTSLGPTSVLGTTSQCAVPESLKTRITHSAPEADHLSHLPEKASFSSNDTSTVPSFPRHVVDALPLQIVRAERANLTTFEKRSLKRQARSSFGKTMPFKRSKNARKEAQKEIGTHSPQPSRTSLSLLSSNDQARSSPNHRSDGIFYNSFGPLYNLRSSTTFADDDAISSDISERDASINSSENTNRCNQDSDMENADNHDLDDQTFPLDSALDEGAMTGDSTLPGSLSTDWKAQVRQSKSSSARHFPLHSNTSSSSGSRSTSSDMELIVEQDQHAREVSRQEQAKSWQLLTRQEIMERNKAKQPETEVGEVRLSEDEQKAMAEAMQRSLDELTEEFDDIFLEDRSSGDGDL